MDMGSFQLRPLGCGSRDKHTTNRIKPAGPSPWDIASIHAGAIVGSSKNQTGQHRIAPGIKRRPFNPETLTYTELERHFARGDVAIQGAIN